MKQHTMRGRRVEWRPATVIVAVAGAALLAACGGSHPSAPRTSSGQPTRQQVNAYVHCMQGHGITNFYLSRPGTPNNNGGLAIGLVYGDVVNVDVHTQQYQSARSACQHLMPGAVLPPLTSARLRSMDRAAACMRVHGFPGYPDPDVQNGQLVPNPLPSGIDVSSPQFTAAIKTCGNPGQ